MQTVGKKLLLLPLHIAHFSNEPLQGRGMASTKDLFTGIASIAQRQ
jgi:hypothetical protein